MTLVAVTLDDKYAAPSGNVYMTGTQALVRLPMIQHLRDKAAGLDTACMISGYRGSPLGNFDRALWQAQPFLEKHGVHFQPGVNEDTAATALWGTQQVGLFPGAKHEGVFAIWYGKGPGVDRTMDVFKHANNAGTAPHGGVLALAGDDHVCASSTTAHQSEFDFMSAAMPVINPAGVQEFLDYGLHGWGLSRYAGLWVGFICIAETVDSSAIVSVDPHRVAIVTPEDHVLPAGGLNIRLPDTPLEQEERLLEYKLDAARAYGRANGLDRTVIDGPGRRLGIVTTGKSYLDVRQAMDDLGIDEGMARRLGLALYKVGMSWPLEPDGIRRFAGGLDEILVVEEKRGFIENQIKELLYNLPASARPRVIGKCDEEGRPLLRASGELDPGGVAQTLAARLQRFGTDERIEARVALLRARWAESEAAEPAAMERVPYFCSGCPHNSSTKVPEGSRALAGIGCHYMAQWMDRETATFTHMGGEGASWIGQAPFTETPHVFQNIGDGTYFHSGILAIRAAVSAGVNMTYKILYNDAVAMTGGQPMDGPLSVQRVTRQIQAEGVGRIAVVTDQPEKYPFDGQFADGVTIHHRDAARPGAARAAPVGGGLGHRLRPDVRDREAAQAQARPAGGPRLAGHHQPGRVRGLWRLRRAVELPLGRAAGDRFRPQAGDRPIRLQQGFLLHQGFLPELRAGQGRAQALWRIVRRLRAADRRAAGARSPLLRRALRHPARRRRRHRDRHPRRAAWHRGTARGQGGHGPRQGGPRPEVWRRHQPHPHCRASRGPPCGADRHGRCQAAAGRRPGGGGEPRGGGPARPQHLPRRGQRRPDHDGRLSPARLTSTSPPLSWSGWWARRRARSTSSTRRAWRRR